MDLTISSYNCRGLPKENKKLLLRPDILEVLDKSHIVAIQETWYAKQNLKALNSLHKDYIGTGAATVDETHDIIHGHYPGGVALLWRKELSKNIKRLEFNTDWAVAIEIDLGTRKLIILNIYMPYQCLQNKEQYIDNLGNILSFIESLQNTNIMIIGDWNANLGDSGSSIFKPLMLDFCRENNLIISTKTILPVDSYSHITTRHDCHYKTWIDHVVTSHDMHWAISNINILYDITDEDHIPFQIQVMVDNIPSVTQETNDLAPKINWNMVKDYELLT